MKKMLGIGIVGMATLTGIAMVKMGNKIVERVTEVAMEKIGNKIGERLATKAINDAVDKLEKMYK